MAHPSANIKIKNRKASFTFDLIEEFTAGIILTGTEIKSLRKGKASLSDSYCQFHNHELYVKNMHIAEYAFGTSHNHFAKRDRKLLLNRQELNKIERKTKESGFTIIPILLYINEKGFAKLEIAIARGRKTYDKRESIRQKDAKRDADRQLKH